VTHAALLRRTVCSYLQINAPFFSSFSPNFDHYVTNLSNDGIWGDHLSLQALTEVFQVSCEVYAPATTDRPTTLSNFASVTGVVKLWYDGGHYDSLVPRGSNNNSNSNSNNRDNNAAAPPWRGLRQTAPGVIEEQALNAASLEDVELQISITESRSTFNASLIESLDLLSVDSAIAEAEVRESEFGALQQIEDDLVSSVMRDTGEGAASGGGGGGLSDFDLAIRESRQQHESAEPADPYDIDEAIARSLAEADNSSSGGFAAAAALPDGIQSFGDAAADDDDEALLQHAMMMSLQK
jgi:hypothetical protein